MGLAVQHLPSPPSRGHSGLCSHGFLAPGPAVSGAGPRAAEDDTSSHLVAEPTRPPASIFARSLSATDVEVVWASPQDRNRGRIQGYEVSRDGGSGLGKRPTPPASPQGPLAHRGLRPGAWLLTERPWGRGTLHARPQLPGALRGVSQAHAGPGISPMLREMSRDSRCPWGHWGPRQKERKRGKGPAWWFQCAISPRA